MSKQNPYVVGAVIEVSIGASLNRLGSAAGLAALDWRIHPVSGLMEIEGRPFRKSRMNECVLWAHRLGMSEAFPAIRSGRSWDLIDGPWHVTIVSTVGA